MNNGRDKPKTGILASRRHFLRNAAAGLAAPALAGGWLSGHGAITAKAYSRGSYALELDGAGMGFVSGVSGGYYTGDVVLEKPGPDRIRRKHLAGAKIEPISVEVG